MTVSDVRALTWRWAASASAEDLRDASRLLDALTLPPVDTREVSPLGFDPLEDAGKAPVGRLIPGRAGRGLVLLDDDDAVVTTLSASGRVEGEDVARMRGLRHVRAQVQHFAGPVQLASVLRHLAVAGVPVVTGPLPVAVHRLLGRQLAGLVEVLSPGTTADALLREAWSVSTRRTALTEATGILRDAPSVSVVAGSRTAEGTARLRRQLQDQTWQPSEVVEVPAQEAGNALQRCSGDLVALVDDCLWYGPHHLHDLVVALRYSGADVVGCRPVVTYLPDLDLTVKVTGEPGERWSTHLHPATLVAAHGDAAGRGADPFDRERRYAVHPLGVLRVETEEGAREAALQAAVGQWPGSPPLPDLALVPPLWAPPGRSASFRSWFDRA